ncbi:MAG: germination protein YpeB [Firmicutes bacterium]|nr:germination protein YpeB [Candidatus Fermentithermobacillaceae bacterium]
MNSGRRGRIALWALAVVAILAVGFGISQHRAAQSSRLQVTATRQRALFSLINHVENMEAAMAKARAASSSGQKVTFLTNVWYHAGAAQEAVSLAPIASIDLSRLKQFFGVVGDYALVLSQKIARGDMVTPDEWAELNRLEGSVKDLATMLADTGSRVAVTGFGFGAPLSLVRFGASPPDDPLFRGFSEIDDLLQSVPSPTYDGPFSEQNLKQRPLAPAFAGQEITQERAKELGLSFIPADDTWESVRVERIDGAIPCYMVTGKRRDGSEVTAAVSRSGGRVLWVQDSRLPGTPRLTLDAAREQAKSFLTSKGFGDMVETGWRKGTPASSRVVLAYAPAATLDGRKVVLYPDTVKVEVALDTGRIVAFDQTAYLTNHITRDFPATTVYTPEEAAKVLDPSLKQVGPPRLVVAPRSPGQEILAWEFRVQKDQDTYLVYINAQTGREEIILRVIESPSGAVTS